ncbi:MAG: hypothetical protein WCL25_05025, partial [bacterium]
ILSVLIGLALPRFNKARERDLGREAKANLRRIFEAEKNYRLEMETYYPPTSGTVDSISDINSNLSLFITGSNWSYEISSTDGSDFTAYAYRAGSGGYLDCEYFLSNDNEDLTPVNCP